MASLNYDDFQDVLGQLPRLKTYSHMLVCFSVRDGLTRAALTTVLEKAATALTDTFPWLACRAIHQDRDVGTSGSFALAPWPENSHKSILQVQDCTNVCPTYREMLSSDFPVSMLDSGVLASLPAFPHIYEDTELNPAPVLAIRANFVQGGLLLDFAAQHNFIDGGGLMRIIEHVAKIMRGESCSRDEIEHGNRRRSDLIPLLRPGESMLDHNHLIRESLTAPLAPAARQTSPCWRFVRFSAAQVARLKHLANADLQDDEGSFVSTNDTLSAFIWKCVAAVRLKRRQKPDDFSKFSRAIDARRALGIPRDYLGQMGYNATCSMSFRELEAIPLGRLALFMRRAVEKVNNEYSVRSWATFIAREPDKSKIMFGGSFNPDTDIGLSSVIHASVEGVDFGILGKPDVVRRQNFLPLESCVYLWTKGADGRVDSLLCLKDVDWNGLHADAKWTNYVSPIDKPSEKKHY